MARAAAGSTDLLRPAQRSRSAALAASIQAQDRELFHRAAHCFPEIDFDLVFEIVAPLRLGDSRLGARTTEELAEQVPEACAAGPAEIEPSEIEMDSSGSGARAGRRAALVILGVEAELVVHLTLLAVGEYVIGFLNLLELLFG